MPGIGTRWAWRSAGLLFLVGLLLTGCQSQQAAFSFRPGPVAATLLPTASDSVPVLPPLQASTALRPASPIRSRVVFPTRHSATGKASLSTSRPQTRSKTSATPQLTPRKALQRQARPQGREHDTLHLVLGGLLIIGGVLAGLLLGGWLGLGVGALIVVLGYYFLVMGIGGSHAWREVFQEFFNM